MAIYYSLYTRDPARVFVYGGAITDGETTKLLGEADMSLLSDRDYETLNKGTEGKNPRTILEALGASRYKFGGNVYHQLPNRYTFDEALDFVKSTIEALSARR